MFWMWRDTTVARPSTSGDTLDRIAVFGISRSGKDYTINGAVEKLSAMGLRYRHLSMIGTVNSLRGERKLSQMAEMEKLALMEKVHFEMDSASVMSNTIVDEHYCFPGTYGGKVIHTGYVDEKLPYREYYDEELETPYEVVFDESELVKYRIVVFLDIDPEIILERFRTSEGCKRNDYITLKDVSNWILFEKTGIRNLCRKHSIPFYTLKDLATTSADLVGIIRG